MSHIEACCPFANVGYSKDLLSMHIRDTVGSEVIRHGPRDIGKTRTWMKAVMQHPNANIVNHPASGSFDDIWKSKSLASMAATEMRTGFLPIGNIGVC